MVFSLILGFTFLLYWPVANCDIISEFIGIKLGMCTFRESTMVCVCDIMSKFTLLQQIGSKTFKECEPW